jgi:hypothetical protein
MKTIRLVKLLESLQQLTPRDLKNTAEAFNNSDAVIKCIVDYLNHEVSKIDKVLENPKALYQNEGSDRYVAFKLAERANTLKLIRLLTEETKVLDDDQSGDYNE